MERYPLFEDAIRQRVVQDTIRQNPSSTIAMVISYDPETNTANVLSAQPGTDMPGERYDGVLCPTHFGVQTVDPEPGTPCWLVFRDGAKSDPFITHFFGSQYKKHNYEPHTDANSGIPHYIMEL